MPFRLLPWQKLVILGLFAVDSAGIRLIRWALVGIAKKNGKTELAAALGLYFLIASGEPSPVVVVAAASEEQADLVFGAAATMCRMSPTLSQITEVYGKEILVPSIPGAVLKRVAAAAGTNDGQNIYVVICDELHEWTGKRGRDVWTILTNGTASRREPMIIQITTAGYDKDTVCGEQYDKLVKILKGLLVDIHFFGYWVEPAAGLKANYKDVKVWKEANPSWGITQPRPLEYMATQLANKTEADVRRYNLNQWTLQAQIWEAAALWDDCRDPELGLDPKKPLFVAVDVGVKHDSCAVGWTQKLGERYPVRCEIWENPHPRGTKQHDEYRFEISEAEDLLRELRKTFRASALRDDKGRRLPGPAFYYDPMFFERSAQDLKHEGLTMLEYSQSDSRMIPVSTSMYQLVKTGAIAHDGDPGLRRHVRQVVAVLKPRGWRMDRPHNDAHIDAAIATAIATFEASRQPEAPPEPQMYSWEDLEKLADDADDEDGDADDLEGLGDDDDVDVEDVDPDEG